jgi:hypothetical protein
MNRRRAMMDAAILLSPFAASSMSSLAADDPRVEDLVKTGMVRAGRGRQDWCSGLSRTRACEAFKLQRPEAARQTLETKAAAAMAPVVRLTSRSA